MPKDCFLKHTAMLKFSNYIKVDFDKMSCKLFLQLHKFYLMLMNINMWNVMFTLYKKFKVFHHSFGLHNLFTLSPKQLCAGDIKDIKEMSCRKAKIMNFKISNQ